MSSQRRTEQDGTIACWTAVSNQPQRSHVVVAGERQLKFRSACRYSCKSALRGAVLQFDGMVRHNASILRLHVSSWAARPDSLLIIILLRDSHRSSFRPSGLPRISMVVALLFMPQPKQISFECQQDANIGCQVDVPNRGLKLAGRLSRRLHPNPRTPHASLNEDDFERQV